MELRVLQYFLAVAREQSISAAAESLHISQPALSTQMKALEAELGKQLLTRGVKGSRRVMLTDEGMVLRKRAEEIDGLRGEVMENSFGSQVRNYVLYPYQMVKDLRSGEETGNVDAVLDGDLEDFVIGYHKWKASQ